MSSRTFTFSACSVLFFWLSPLCVPLFLFPSLVGGHGWRFMSWGEYLSVTDQLVLLWWQVSPSPQWCLSSPALISAPCLAKWGLETHLLPARRSNDWRLVWDLCLKLCGGLAHSSDWALVLYPSSEAYVGGSGQKGAPLNKKAPKSETLTPYARRFEWYAPAIHVSWAVDVIATLLCLRTHNRLVQYSEIKPHQP